MIHLDFVFGKVGDQICGVGRGGNYIRWLVMGRVLFRTQYC